MAMEIDRNVEYVQAANCVLCIHIGTTAVFFGIGAGGFGARLELFTPCRSFRWRNRIKDSRSAPTNRRMG